MVRADATKPKTSANVASSSIDCYDCPEQDNDFERWIVFDIDVSPRECTGRYRKMLYSVSHSRYGLNV